MDRMVYASLAPEVNEAASRAIDGALQVHRALGPGFKEKIYHRAFCLELDSRGVHFETEKAVLVKYKTWEIPGQKIDLIVEGCVLVEIKAIPRLKEIHRSQIISYLRTTGLRLGLLINFNTRLMKHGLRRVIL
jgi:GxxExxY protein